MKNALQRTEREERQTVEGGDRRLPHCWDGESVEAYWCVLLFGGLRPSEALALRWEDIRGDTVHLHRVLVNIERRDMHFAPPRSKKSRRGVLPAVAVEALREHRRRQSTQRAPVGSWKSANYGRPGIPDIRHATAAIDGEHPALIRWLNPPCIEKAILTDPQPNPVHLTDLSLRSNPDPHEFSRGRPLAIQLQQRPVYAAGAVNAMDIHRWIG